MDFAKLIIGFLVFSVIMVGSVMFIKSYNEEYSMITGNVSDEHFNDTYNTIDELYELDQKAYNKSLLSETEGGDESWNSMIKGAFGAVKFIPQTFTLFSSISGAIGREFGISCSDPYNKSPSCFILDAAFVGFSVMVIFGIIYMLLKYTPQ